MYPTTTAHLVLRVVVHDDYNNSTSTTTAQHNNSASTTTAHLVLRVVVHDVEHFARLELERRLGDKPTSVGCNGEEGQQQSRTTTTRVSSSNVDSAMNLQDGP